MQKKPLFVNLSIMVLSLMAGAAASLCLYPPAQSGRDVQLSTAKTLVQSASHGQAVAKKVFQGPGGLTGVILDAHHHNMVAWIAGGKYLIVGPVLNSMGQNETVLAMKKHHLLPPVMAPVAFAQMVSKEADSFVVGKAGPEITAFVDPNCIFCHEFYEQAKPLIAAGKLRVRFVVVGFLKPNSAAKAAAILGAKDPQSALAADERGFDTKTEEGGIQPMNHPSPALREDVRKNTLLLLKSGEMATPTLITCNRKTGLHVIHGLPEGGLKQIIGQLGGESCKG
jgi:thiol:disulfide interchange protein DsbG